jgi:hypothetical protein
MTLDNLAALAEVIGAIAVVVSLVYVGYQVKQNTSAIRTQVHETIVGHVLEAEGSLLHNADLAKIVVKATSVSESLTPDEQLRADTYFTHEFVNWESAFLHHKNGFVEDEMWRRWDLSARPDKDSPGQYKYWTAHRYWYDDEFARHVDTVFGELGYAQLDTEV